MQAKNTGERGKKIKINLAFFDDILYNIGMYTFNYKFGKTVLILLIAVIPITLAGFGWNVFNVIELHNRGFLKVFTYSLTAAVTLGLFVFEIAALVHAKYTVKNGYLYCAIGFIRSKIAIDDVVTITVQNGKLMLLLKNSDFTVIVIDKSNYPLFIESLKAHNPRIQIIKDEQAK